MLPSSSVRLRYHEQCARLPPETNGCDRSNTRLKPLGPSTAGRCRVLLLGLLRTTSRHEVALTRTPANVHASCAPPYSLSMASRSFDILTACELSATSTMACDRDVIVHCFQQCHQLLEEAGHFDCAETRYSPDEDRSDGILDAQTINYYCTLPPIHSSRNVLALVEDTRHLLLHMFPP